MATEKAQLQAALETNPLAKARLVQIERDLLAWATRPLEFSFDPSGTPLFSMMELTHSYARRCVALSEAIRLLVEQNHIVPATILARSLIETVATGCLFIHDMSRLIAAGDRERLDNRVGRFYAGFKGSGIEPIHVMDAMRHLETIDGEYVSYLDEKYGVFSAFLEGIQATDDKAKGKTVRELLSAMSNYDLLSEVAHPNGLGTQFLYPDASNENVKVTQARARFRSASLMAIWQCHHLLVALDTSMDLPSRYRIAFMLGA